MKTFLIINSISGTKINIQLIIETPKFHSCKEYVNKYNAQVGYEISPSTAGQNTSNFFDIAGSISTSKNNNLKWHRDLPSKRWFCVRFCLLFAVTFLKPLNIITKKYFVALNWFPCNYIFLKKCVYQKMWTISQKLDMWSFWTYSRYPIMTSRTIMVKTYNW